MSNAMTAFEMLPFGGGIDADQEELRRRATGGARSPSRSLAGSARQADAVRQAGQGRTRFPGSLGPGAAGFRHQRHRVPRGYGPFGRGVDVIADDPASSGPLTAGTAPSEQIRWVQYSLNSILGSNLPTDGVVSPDLRSALRTFQGQQGLPPSGFVGPDTITALQNATGQSRTGPGSTGPGSNGPGSEGGEFEFVGEFELTQEQSAAEAALADPSRARPVLDFLRTPVGPPLSGLYRLINPAGVPYTGMSIDIRRRVREHTWCASHLGVSMRGWNIALHLMPGKTARDLRIVEKAINLRQKALQQPRLNTNTELEMLEIGLT
jgi:hypothetical protein